MVLTLNSYSGCSWILTLCFVFTGTAIVAAARHCILHLSKINLLPVEILLRKKNGLYWGHYKLKTDLSVWEFHHSSNPILPYSFPILGTVTKKFDHRRMLRNWLQLLLYLLGYHFAFAHKLRFPLFNNQLLQLYYQKLYRQSLTTNNDRKPVNLSIIQFYFL